MWVETILSRDDLANLLAQALPLTIHLGDETPSNEGEKKADPTLTLHDLAEVSLVPEVGLRVTCKAKVHWPLLGIDVPIALNTLTLSILPLIKKGAIEKGEGGDMLVFQPSIEHADFAGLPTAIDNRITDAINAKLAGPEVDLSWNFTKALTIRAALPALLEPLDAFALRPAWGKIRITEEALVYAVSFHSALVRKGEAVPSDLVDPFVPPSPAWNGAESHDEPIAPTSKPSMAAKNGDGRSRSGNGSLARAELFESPIAAEIVRIGAFGLASGAAYFALRAAFRGRF